jgi:hypothetical protein
MAELALLQEFNPVISRVIHWLKISTKPSVGQIKQENLILESY